MLKYKNYFALLAVVLMVLAFAACTRSANPDAASVTEPTETAEGGVQPTADEVMGQLELFVTQTAAASQGLDAQPTAQPPTGETPSSGTDTAETGPVPTEAPPTEDAQSVPTATPEPTQEPVPTAVTVPTATPGIPKSYTLKGGEHVYCISRRFNVNPNEVLRLNGMGSGSLVYAGMTLKLPQTGNPFPGNRALLAHPTTYTVKSGDTIYSVACQFGDVSPEAIAYANGLSEPYRISAGQQLNIP